MKGLEIVTIDYENKDVPVLVQDLKPQVYKDGDSFCCLLGPDPQAGVFGCGNDVDAALNDWVLHLRERIAKPNPDDAIAMEITDYLSMSKKDVW